MTAREGLLAEGASAKAGAPAGSSADCGPGGGAGEGTAAAATGGRAGPLSARQRFLLGRKVDVNAAGWEDISGLPGISDAVAREVVERRRRAGPFRRAEDLLDVRGIKARRLKKILPFLSGFHNN